MLLCCARTQIDGPNAERLSALVSASIDWNYLIRAASTHGVKPLLCRHLSRVSPENIGPALNCGSFRSIKDWVSVASINSSKTTTEIVGSFIGPLPPTLSAQNFKDCV